MNDRISLEDLAAMARTEAEIRSLDASDHKHVAADALESSDEYRTAEWQASCDGPGFYFSNCVTRANGGETIYRCAYHGVELIEAIAGQVDARSKNQREDVCEECSRSILDCWKIETYDIRFAIAYPATLAWSYYSKSIEA